MTHPKAKVTNFDYTATDFEPGQNVCYVPNHAFGDLHHKDNEYGVVTSVSERTNTVFVCYNGDLYSKATDPSNLVPMALPSSSEVKP